MDFSHLRQVIDGNSVMSPSTEGMCSSTSTWDEEQIAPGWHLSGVHEYNIIIINIKVKKTYYDYCCLFYRYYIIFITNTLLLTGSKLSKGKRKTPVTRFSWPEPPLLEHFQPCLIINQFDNQGAQQKQDKQDKQGMQCFDDLPLRAWSSL